jgi:predicted AAA+ superfamily ATPase
MIKRQQTLSKNNSLFLFGARGTGKSTLLTELYRFQDDVLWIDLLSVEDEERFGRRPQELAQILENSTYKKVIIDEVQKAPKLLDIVHQEIEKK